MLLIKQWQTIVSRGDYVKLKDVYGRFTLGVVSKATRRIVYVRPAKASSNPMFSTPVLEKSRSFNNAGYDTKFRQYSIVGVYRTIEGLYELYGRDIPFHTATIEKFLHRASNGAEIAGFADWSNAKDPYTICIHCTHREGKILSETVYVPTAERIDGERYKEVWLW